ncbi:MULTISPECIES: MerR family transcriptional regulator [Methylobacterium]|jgi:DNA-binding transcriptional MerR regulator|uniref:DNA-binding transcriptional MerR regulator n=1 Tax=Methylobacterium brachiatum TaxID=269660 RepID=A0AAJ1TYU4_9HYPH|nr:MULTISPECIES: MerR family transcriptional regulator [Methylobacterium]AYO84821.1 MerR family transcriptional regulator [Methylobacterium brachiatum]EIZ84062.1 MerR family transcriptional regulator [Methylobacterium sp. GXF4]MCB4805201.1 MerR family transcriptional regulator [Methylobacterium brachiatum]MDF2599880.1 MerR family transcriptional regulator [Methylobacterium brachiatum]MDQ0546248.1 DNA-binding transcriptional MerR regulator [Methylobacterium brachiatum]
MPPALAADTPLEPIGEKSAGAFRTISEVSEELDVPQHVLRFWETRFGQIRPVKRAGGRRYYRPQDVELVAGIRQLLYVQRYTIAGAQRVLKENGIRFVQAVGRGEAKAAEPQIQEVEGGLDAGIRADTPDRAALLGVLEDLHACRSLLDALRRPYDRDV